MKTNRNYPLLWSLEDWAVSREGLRKHNEKCKLPVKMALLEADPANLRDHIRNNSSPEPFTGCWLWEEAFSGPYGRSTMTSESRANCVSYHAFHGEIPFGMVVRHKCDCTICVNPAHLELGSQTENKMDFLTRGQFQPEYLQRVACRLLSTSSET